MISKRSKLTIALRKTAIGVGFLTVVTLALIWLAGAFHKKIGTTAYPGPITALSGRPIGDARLVCVRKIQMPRVESSIGTIKAVHEAAVASKLLAKVVDVRVIAGQRVEAGDLLVQLDDADLKARSEQAQAAARSAQAARDQAKIEHERVAKLYEQSAAASIELDRVQNALRSAEAELTRTEQATTEGLAILEYAAIRSPIHGVVIDKKIEVGDMVSPGQVLLTLYDATRMQLVASVRESLSQRLTVGQTVEVEIDALKKRCAGRVSEIVPEAQAASRSFLVKVTGPCPSGIYSGMFGRLLIPLDEEELTVISKRTVQRIGQLDVVDVADGNLLRRRAIQVGREFGDDIEVLAGLRDGEQVALLGLPIEGVP
jgi:RND family efflux transporter MFP subunit